MVMLILSLIVGLKNFNMELKVVGYDLNSWSEKIRMSLDFSIFDFDFGSGWDLVIKFILESGFLGSGCLFVVVVLSYLYFLLGGD